MEQHFFFDKRYSRPFSFTGTQIFNKKNKNSEIQIFEVMEKGSKSYIFVYCGKENTELYKVGNFLDFIDFFQPIDSMLLEFLEKNCESVFIYSNSSRKNDNKFFGEDYEIYNFKKDKYNILIIKIGDEFKWDVLSGIVDNISFYRSYLSVFLLKKISRSENFRSIYALKKRAESKMMILNDSTDGRELLDTGVSSIKEKSAIGIYGNKIEYFKSDEYENCHLIITDSGYYLTLNDTIYFDFDCRRLLLNLPESSYILFTELKEKCHIFIDDTKSEIHEIFKKKKYKEEVIRLSLKDKGSENKELTKSKFLMKDYYMDYNSCLNFFNIDYDSNCGDLESQVLESLLKANKLIPYYSSFPIYTNFDILLKKERKGSMFYLLEGKNDLIVVVESKNKNYFYNVIFHRILFNLIENKIVPFTFQELFETGRFLMPNSLEDLMSIKCKQNSSI